MADTSWCPVQQNRTHKQGGGGGDSLWLRGMTGLHTAGGEQWHLCFYDVVALRRSAKDCTTKAGVAKRLDRGSYAEIYI